MADFFKKKVNYCSCKAHSSVYQDDSMKYEYLYNFHYSSNEESTDILILMEFMEPEENLSFLKRFCSSYFKDYDYTIIPALGCTPKDFGFEDTIVTYSYCKELHIKKQIEKYKPKVILTIGKALYTITESKDLKPENFFVPIGEALLPFQEDDTWLYSPEFNCKVFPIPALYQWVHKNSGSPKDVYEFKFSVDQAKRLISSLSQPKIRIRKLEYEIVKEPSDLLKKFRDNDLPLAIDTESAGLNYFKDELYSIQFAENSSKGYFCFWKDIDKNLLIDIFNNKNKTIIMHNALHDIPFLISNDITNARCDYDTMLCSHILNENSPQGLKPNTWIYTYHGGYEEELKRYMKTNRIKDYTVLPIDILSQYGAYDPIVTYQLYMYQKERLEKEDPDIKYNFYNYVMPSVAMTIDMQMEGVPIDMKYLYEYNDSLEKELSNIRNEIYKIVGKEFNLRSPKDLSEAFKNSENFKMLTDREGKPLVTKNGDLVLNKQTLPQYEKMGVKIAYLIKKANHLSKEISQLGLSSSNIETTSSRGLFSVSKDEEDDEEGYMQSLHNNKLYGAYKLHGTDTGRAASGTDKDQQESVKVSKKGSFGINFQNIPAKKEFRKLFLVPEGYVLGNADYDSMEISIFSQFAGKGVFEDIILSGKDPHCCTLVAIFKEFKKEGIFNFYKKYKDDLPLKKDEDVLKYLEEQDFENITYDIVKHKVKVEEDKFYVTMRSKVSKILNWMVLYGASGFGLAMTLGIEKDAGEALLVAFKKMYPDVDGFINQQTDFAKKYGYVKTFLGRKRRLPELTYIGSDSYKNYSSTFKISNLINNSFNACVQGTSGQVTLIAMTNIWRELKEKNMKSKLIINVHDELVMITYIPETKQIKEIVERWMTHKYYEAKGGNKVTLQAEFEIGEIWKDCKSVSYWDKNPEEYKNMILQIETRNREMKKFLAEKNS